MSLPQGLYFEPLVNQFQPGKLADLSAVSLVAGLTHKNLVRIRRDTNTRIYHYSSPELDENGSIPKPIRSTLINLISTLEKSWSGWWLHHHKNIFFEHQPADDLIDWSDLLIWLPDGTINYEQTARKLLNSDRLTKVQQFQLACAYCFIDDVKRLKQTLTRNEMKKATDGRRKYCDQFLNYWSRRMNLEGKIDHENLLDKLLFKLARRHHSEYKLKRYNEWPAINFFLSRIQSRNRLSKIRDIIKLGIPRLTWLLLPTLSEIDFHSIISKESSLIMGTFIENRLYLEFTMLVWQQMVHVIDNIELVRILRRVSCLDFKRSNVNDVLWRMWLALSEFQKDSIAEEGIYNYSLFRLSAPNYPLLTDVFSRSTSIHRNVEWTIYWPYLVIGQLDHRESIDHLMKLSFENDQQIQDFKKNTMTDYKLIRYCCNILLKQGRINDIQTYLEFCTSDSQVIRDLMRTIIKKMPKDYFFRNFFYRRCNEKAANFNRYLEDLFTEDERKKLFNKMATSRSNLKKMSMMLHSSRKLGDVMKFIETFVTSEERLTKAKAYFLEHFRRRGRTSPVNLDLMAWCLDSDKRLVENIKKFGSFKDQGTDDGKSSIDEDVEMVSTDVDVDSSSTDEDSDDERVPQKKRRLEPGCVVFNIFIKKYEKL